MTEFKKGDRVQWDRRDGTTNTGTVSQVGQFGDLVFGDTDGGHAFAIFAHRLTKITDPTPLRFEDVKTGDKITVAVDGITVSGPVQAAYMNGVHMGTTGTSFPIIRSFGKWVDRLQREVTLTAHEPGEPEWHRAKVIKARTPDGLPDYLIGKGSLGFVDAYGMHYKPDRLTNVVIIVDEHNEVRAA